MYSRRDDYIRLAQSRLYRRWGWRFVKLALFAIAMYILCMVLTTIMQRAVDSHIIHERVTQGVTRVYG